MPGLAFAEPVDYPPTGPASRWFVLQQPAPDNDHELVFEAVQAFLSGRQNSPGNPAQIVSTEAVVWPNSCLGVDRPGRYCLQVLTPGYRIQVDVNGTRYTVHTNQTGSSILIVNRVEGAAPIIPPPPPPPPAPPLPGPGFGNDISALVTLFISQTLNVPLDSVAILSAEPVRWPDSCLGFPPPPGSHCMQVITPGYRVIAQVNGQVIEVHTNLDGSRILIGAGLPVAPPTEPEFGPGLPLLPIPVRPPVEPPPFESFSPVEPGQPISDQVLPGGPASYSDSKIDRFLPDR